MPSAVEAKAEPNGASQDAPSLFAHVLTFTPNDGRLFRIALPWAGPPNPLGESPIE